MYLIGYISEWEFLNLLKGISEVSNICLENCDNKYPCDEYGAVDDILVRFCGKCFSLNILRGNLESTARRRDYSAFGLPSAVSNTSRNVTETARFTTLSFSINCFRMV